MDVLKIMFILKNLPYCHHHHHQPSQRPYSQKQSISPHIDILYRQIDMKMLQLFLSSKFGGNGCWVFNIHGVYTYSIYWLVIVSGLCAISYHISWWFLKHCQIKYTQFISIIKWVFVWPRWIWNEGVCYYC